MTDTQTESDKFPFIVANAFDVVEGKTCHHNFPRRHRKIQIKAD